MKIDISRANLPNTKLHVHVMGQDANKPGSKRPVAFILPGGPGADHTAYHKYSCLNEVIDLVFHDPRGCGQSDKGDASTYTMHNYIEDVEALRKHFGLNKIILIGKSYGAMCALGYALRYPQAVQKLVLSAGAPSARFLETAKSNVTRRGTPEQIEACKKLFAGSFKNREDLLRYFQLTNSLYSVQAKANPKNFDLITKSRQFSYEVLNEGFRHSFWRFDYENELQKIICPTLILAGRQDWIADVKYSEFMVARIPHSQLRVFEQAGHALETDATTDYFQAITEFLR